jgi:hypothetical protein
MLMFPYLYKNRGSKKAIEIKMVKMKKSMGTIRRILVMGAPPVRGRPQ